MVRARIGSNPSRNPDFDPDRQKRSAEFAPPAPVDLGGGGCIGTALRDEGSLPMASIETKNHRRWWFQLRQGGVRRRSLAVGTRDNFESS